MPTAAAYVLRETTAIGMTELDLVDETGEIVAHCELHNTTTATWLLTNLWVLEPQRRRGLGGRIVGEACARADAMGVRLTLTASAYPAYPDETSGSGKVALDQAELEDFYRRRGFADVGPFSFVRSPNPTTGGTPC